MTATGPPAVGRVDEIVVDCRDVSKLASFWGALFGVAPKIRDATWATVRDAEGGLVVAFQEVAEPKAGKNRVHIDIRVAHLEDAVAACVALGAVTEGPIRTDDEGLFQLMSDPEGNEFCLVI